MAGPVMCADCGAANDPGDEFCGQCGRYLGWSGSAAPGQDEAMADPTTERTDDTVLDPGPSMVSGGGQEGDRTGTAEAAAVPPVPPVIPPPPVSAAPPVSAPPPVTAPPPPIAAPASPVSPAPQPPSQRPASGPAATPPPVPIPSGPTYQPQLQVMPPPVMNGVTCRTCGLVNPPGRTFCQRCGAQLDPAVGTMAGAPRPAGPAAATAASSGSGGGHRLAFAGIGLIVIVAVIAAALVFGGVLGGPSPSPTGRTAAASGTPVPSAVATDAPPTDVPATLAPEPTAEPTAEPTTQPSPTDAPTTAPTEAPTPTRRPAPTQRPTPRPTRTPRPTATPTALPLPVGWVCDGSSVAIPDPLSLGWNVRRVDWTAQDGADRLIVTLARDPRTGGDGTQAIVHVLPIDEVATTLKVVAPSEGDTAIALGLFQDVRLTWSVDQQIRLPALHWVTLGKDDNGFAWVVVGVDDDPCYQLQVPDWTADDPLEADTIQVTLDVQR